MPIHISNPDSREACLRALLIEATPGKEFPDTAALQSSGCHSRLLFYDDRCPDFCIRLSHYINGADNSRSESGQDKPLLTLQFVLQDTLHYTLEGNPKQQITEGQYNLLAAPSTARINWFGAANRNTSTLDIHFSRVYLEQFCQDLPGLSRFLEETKQGKPLSLGEAPATVDPCMLHFLNAIISCPHTGELRLADMQTKVYLLLVLALGQILSQPKRHAQTVLLSRYELDKIYEARQYMRQHIENPPTLIELARKVGINDFKLKKAYKQVFHTTIFGDFNDFRMERAQKLLLETDMNIADISLSTGYEDPPNFIRAFKAHYGIAPSHFRKQNGYKNHKQLS